MKRRIILAAIGALMMQPAKADVPVIDFASIVQAIKQVEWLRDQYEQMTQQLYALTNTLNVATVARDLLTPGMQNPLDELTGQLPELVGGAILSEIPGAHQFLQRDRLYQPSGTDFTANALNGSATSLANLKAIAMQQINGNGQRIGLLSGLIAELTGAHDVSQVARINGRIAVENQTLAAQAAQFQQLQQMADLEQRVQQQRVQQRMRSDDDAQIEDTRSGANPITPQVPQARPFFGG